MSTRRGIARLARLIALSALSGATLAYSAVSLRAMAARFEEPPPTPGPCACLVACPVPVAARTPVEYRGVSYRHARLTGSLRGRTFVDCDFAGADLTRLDLRDCRFWNCDLRTARLDRANLRGARYNEGTGWPARFDVAARGADRVPYTDLPLPVAALTTATLPKH